MNWRYLTVGILAIATALWRTYNAETMLAPNLETVTVLALVSFLLLRGPAAWIAPISVLLVTDLVIGNSSILLFTWSAWFAMFLVSLLMRNKTGGRAVLFATGIGLGASVWFFLWTNFGHWLLYMAAAGGAAGLMSSYVAGLPFFRTMILGNLIIVPVVIASVELLRHRFEAPKMVPEYARL